MYLPLNILQSLTILLITSASSALTLRVGKPSSSAAAYRPPPFVRASSDRRTRPCPPTPLGRTGPLSMSEGSGFPLPSPSVSSSAADDDDDGYEEVTLDGLTASDFHGSEWKVGTLPVGSSIPSDISTTWVRLMAPEGDPKAFGQGRQVAVWGDDSKGTWAFDAGSQFLSFSKDTPLSLGGKTIWACGIDDYYYLSGVVRGWKPWA
eukprot:CAMPEP_0197569638 /NCGR_PEP_ID=MMETSP1320-20131121/39344_1 /TAXON_ID=91990 /ORGANISM="Bolidomonas sp., Strain RCC2347" /LENGTH=205 /DNA_ID=CAMNT_0043132015 /DNA_START=205 /DNA_END=818 /DNA_ORIENTATION=+